MALIAIISDVHADVHALRQALEHIERLGCSAIVCAGDLVDYGLFPGETLALMMERRIPCVRGNHDRWALGHDQLAPPIGGSDGTAHDATGWDLTGRALNYLEALPRTLRVVEDEVRILVCHGSPKSDMDGIYETEPSSSTIAGWLEDAQADVLVVGHTHLPAARRVGRRRLVVNPGTLLREPIPGMEGPWILDKDSGKFVQQERIVGTFGVLDTKRLSFVVRRVTDGEQVELPRSR